MHSQLTAGASEKGSAMTSTTRIDQIVGEIYRISTFSPDAGITFTSS
jgi:hypothetical protein